MNSSIKALFLVMFVKFAAGYLNRVSCTARNIASCTQLADTTAVVARKEKKYIVVTGGVISGIGKGQWCPCRISMSLGGGYF